MPWIYQRSTIGNYQRSGFYGAPIKVSGWSNHSYQREVQWKYSETTPGYPNVYPLPARNFVRHIRRYLLGDLTTTIDYQGNYDGKGIKAYSDTWSGPIAVFPGIDDTRWFPSGPLPDPTDHVINELNEKVKNTQFESRVFLSELPETMRMLAKDANRILQAARAVRKGRFRLAAEHLAMPKTPKGLRRGNPSTVFADNWLKYQFGYKPIVSDMVNLAKATCTSLSQDQYVFLRHSRSVELPYRRDAVAQHGVGGPTGYGGIEVNVRGIYTVTVKAGYTIKVTSSVASSLSQWGLSNPLSAGWELLPFSFVADWFANFGQLIGSLDTWSGKSFVSGYKTKVVSVRATAWPGRIGHPPSATLKIISGFLGGIQITNIDRNVLSGPVPTRLVTNLPDSTWHFITSASLLQKIFRS